FRVPPRRLLDRRARFFQLHFSPRHLSQLPVSNEVKRLRALRHPSFHQPTHFFHPSSRKHRLGPCVYPLIQRFPLRLQSDLDCSPTCQRFPPALIHLRQRPLRQQTNFDRSQKLLLIRR